MFILFAILVIVSIVYYVKERRRKQTLLQRNGIKCPSPRFLDGNFLDLRNRNVPIKNEWMTKYGKETGTHGFYIGVTPFVVTKDVELIRRIQVKDFHLFSQRQGFGLIGGFEADEAMVQSLVHNEVPAERWKEQRSLITSAFSSAKMKTSVPLVNDAIDALLENIEKHKGENDFDIYDLFQRLTMDTIGRSAFGVQTNVQRNKEHDAFFEATKYIFEDRSAGLINILNFANFLFAEFKYVIFPFRWLVFRLARPFGLAKIYYQHKIIHDIILQRRKDIFDPNNPWSRIDLLQQMVEAQMSLEQMSSIDVKKLTAADSAEDTAISTEKSAVISGTSKKVHFMTDNEVASNCALFFDAGYETTSTLLGFVAHVLVNDLPLQDRLREEINSLYGRERKFDYNTMNGLPLLDSVIHETLRMYPPITDFVTRNASVDYEYNGYTIPKGVNVQIAVYQLHHDPNYWEDPETFDPERFYGENKSRTSSVAFQPFGAGPRNCVGLRFALMEAKLAVARLLHKYRLVPGPRTEIGEIDVVYKPISMCPKKGVFVKVVPL